MRPQEIIKNLKFLGITCVGISEILLICTLSMSHWIDVDVNEAHCGLFQYCFVNKTSENVTSFKEEVCAGISPSFGEDGGIISAVSAMLVGTVIVNGLVIFCTKTMSMENQDLSWISFYHRHGGHVVFVVSTLIGWMGIIMFGLNYTNVPLLADGRFGETHRIALATFSLLPIGTFLLCVPAIYKNHHKYKLCNTLCRVLCKKIPATPQANRSDIYCVSTATSRAGNNNQEAPSLPPSPGVSSLHSVRISPTSTSTVTVTSRTTSCWTIVTTPTPISIINLQEDGISTVSTSAATSSTSSNSRANSSWTVVTTTMPSSAINVPTSDRPVVSTRTSGANPDVGDDVTEEDDMSPPPAYDSIQQLNVMLPSGGVVDLDYGTHLDPPPRYEDVCAHTNTSNA